MSVRTARFLIATALMLGFPALVQAQWITFTDMTSTYLSLPGTMETTDPDEKDFALGDLDQDGDLDLVNVRKEDFYGTGSRPHMLIMNVGGVMTDQTATYAPGFNTNPSLARVVVIADFDGDTWLDVVVVNTDSQPQHYYRNLGSSGGNWLGLLFETGRIPTFAPGGRFCSATAGDIDNDGDLDLFLGDYNNTLEDRLLQNGGTGYFTDVTTARFPGGGNASVFSVEANFADIDGDGDQDIVESNGTIGQLRVHVNGGPATVPTPYSFTTVNISVGSATYTSAIGDLNNDGKIDVYQGRDGQDAYTINNIPPGGSVTPANFTTTTLSNAPKTGNFAGNAYIVDMDGDGDKDLAMADTDVDVPGCDRRAVLYRNGTIGPAQAQLLVDPWPATNLNIHTMGTHDLAILDLNGDGLMDIVNARCVGYHVFIQDGQPFNLVVAEPTPGALSININNGAPNMTTYTLIATVQLTPPGSGSFFGLHPSAFDNFVALNGIGPPIVSLTNGSGNYAFYLPGGMPSPFPTQWRSLQLTGPGGVTMTNVATITF